MLRVLVTILLPLLAPFLLYGAWLWLARRGALGGRTAAPETWRDAPWVWLVAASVACAIAILVYLNATSGYPPGTELAPPALVDGVVVPSHPVE